MFEITIGVAVDVAEFNDVGALSLLHHLVRIGFPVLQGDAQGVGACGQLAHVDALESLALCAHQAALQVVELHFIGLHVRGELHAQLIFHRIGTYCLGYQP